MSTTAHPDLTAAGVTQFLDALRGRWLRVRLFECALWGVVVGLFAALLLALFIAVPDPSMLWTVGGFGGLVGLLVAAGLTAARMPDRYRIAQLADSRLALEEKLSSTLELYRFDMARGPVAAALLSVTEAAVKGIFPRRFETYFVGRRIVLGLVGLVLAAALSAVLVWGTWPFARGYVEPLSSAEISEIAQIFADDAAMRQDDELASIAEALEELAAGAEEMPPPELSQNLEDLFMRAGSRFGRNPAHNWAPFEGENSGLAGRIEQFRNNMAANGPAPAPSAGGADAIMPSDMSADDIRASSLPPMANESVSLGLAPPEGQAEGGALEDDGSGHDLGMPPNQMRGEAEGAGSGLSNFAGTGEVSEQAPPGADPGPAAGFGEMRELSSAQPQEGATTRVGIETTEQATEVDDSVMARDWPRLESPPVERAPLPANAFGAVERYFARNRDQQP